MGVQGGRPKKAHGRPSKLTPEIQRDIVDLVKTGNYFETAANACGIGNSTARRWLYDGARQKTGKYRRFRDAVVKAEAFAEASAVSRIRQHGAKVWQAEAWYLERRMPRKWGRWERKDDTEEHAPRRLRLTTENMNIDGVG